MPVPQEIVDAIIDCFGVPLDQPQCHAPVFYRWDLDKTVLNSFALVSKACNHRVRYYLFSHCKVVMTPPFLRLFAQCPDVLLTHTRYLYVYRPCDLEDIRSIIPRFSSSPLARVTFVSAQILAGFPMVFGSILPNVGSVQFERCISTPSRLWSLEDIRSCGMWLWVDASWGGLWSRLKIMKPESLDGCLMEGVMPRVLLGTSFVRCARYASSPPRGRRRTSW